MLQHSTGEGAWRWHRFWEEMIRSDWAGLKRYTELNRDLAPPQAADKRVVFYGNSITEGWVGYDPDFFAKNGYVGRGIGGQTTGQMLVRFRQDVLNLKPAVVVILAGTNDIAGNTGETSLETTFGNLASMAELARANQVHVVLSSVLPVYDYPWSPGLEPADKIVRLNAMLKEYALKNDFEYLDYHSVMADERKGLPEHLAKDGVHPTLEGYKVMEGLVQKAIDKVLSNN
ncbi:MAG: SGNH/GDSL hydrolase family protein [Saprospiraceae bacterium]|nr:SGNH/GDSL hydrolase family protein [Saprospiraceae bacterium]